MHQLSKVPLHIIAANGFALKIASPRLADVVWVLLARAAFRPARGQGITAGGTADKAPQREVSAYVLTGETAPRPVQHVLRFLPHLEGYQGLMFRGLEVDARLLDRDVSGINRAAQHIDDALQAHFSGRGARPVRAALKEAFHLTCRP
ncbi:MAG: hypothetical protein QNI84_17135 [Henriciella sp.]|nr:hypothetical protein [Henriciella sp.]